MTEMVSFTRSFLALFIIVMLLLQLLPGEGMKKYIRFFSRLILSLGFLYPVLSFFYDSDAFLEKIEYETFTANISEISKDMSRLEFVQNDYYLEKYKTAVEQDVGRVAENYVESYGLKVGEVKVKLSENYVIQEMEVTLKEEKEGEIEIESVLIEEGKKQGKNVICEKLKEELEEYYQLDGTEAYVSYAGT
ncbi:MAG: stage III sporulation protein AF [Clostridiales bacterium]|nr:stage III sporulation protein AF [Clostridiales bacterium]